MTTLTFKEFMNSLVLENVHPEIQSIIRGTGTVAGKQSLLAKKIKHISASGGETGLESNMPKGSSRAYLKHKEDHLAMVDGKPAALKTGTKIAITAALDKHHNKKEHDGHSLGQLQNQAENDDHYVNNHHRVLVKDHDKENHYHTNEHGIFPPLIDHDSEHHDWAHVGHSRDIKAGEFRELTKTKEHPKGISHDDFVNALVKRHNERNGKHWGSASDGHLDHVSEHPLVQKFDDYHGNFGAPPHDLRQKKNMGIFEHPHTGERHIVARDHGFDAGVEKAYQDAHRKKSESARYNRY